VPEVGSEEGAGGRDRRMRWRRRRRQRRRRRRRRRAGGEEASGEGSKAHLFFYFAVRPFAFRDFELVLDELLGGGAVAEGVVDGTVG
jgi:hypothetical protein